MSRLIFLNLPSDLTPHDLRGKLTAPKPLSNTTITDVRVVKKRRFAFVGYKTDEEAKKAQAYFDGTFALGGGKVKVDFVSDEPLSTKPAKRLKPSPSVAKPDLNKPGPSKHLQEFLQVMKGDETSGNIPVEDAAVPGDAGWKADGLKTVGKEKKSVKGKERDDTPPSAAAEEGVEEDDDAAWLKKRQKALEVDGADDAAPAPVHADKSLILSTGRLFLRNLSFVTTADELRLHFEPYGHIESVHLPVSHTGEPLGTAFILYRDPENALAAYEALDRKTFQGRLLHILPGRARPGQDVKAQGLGETPGGVLGKVKQGHGELKNQIDAKRKEDSAKGVNWATMYMNSDAVAASVADRMGISKSELLSSDAGSSSVSSAVKLALAETHVIAETKQYFADAGLNIEALQPKVPRSRNIILVKNIPYGTSIHTLTDLFAPHGEISRILLPPAGTIGVVEYKVESDAGRAFKALAYKRLGSGVLYLEKGPIGMFKSDAQGGIVTDAADKEALAQRVAANEDGLAREVAGEDDESGSTLFLKGLSFNTSTQKLQSILSTLPGYSFARVQTKPDPKRPGEKLSMGYGFVGFKTKAEARKALGGLEGFEIDGKTLEAKFAQRGAEEETGKGGAKGQVGSTKSTKLLVKNLAFEVSKKEVRELFSAYGTLKSLRLPRKPLPTSTGAQSTRGFAFLEFTTHAEAARAMEALKHTHLLGRHLVLQWAKEGDSVDVDALREKAGRDFKDGSKKSGKRKLEFGTGTNEENDGMEV